MNEKKLLIVQVRNNSEIRDHDRSHYERILAGRIAFDIKNVTDDSIHLDHVEKYDGYIVGGSHFMTYEDFPQKEELFNLVRYAVDSRKPFLGICFGFQVLVEGIGGTVVHDKERKEFGTYQAHLTPDGEDDALFEGVPREFLVQEAHESYAPELPPNCIHLVSGEGIAMQGIRYGSASIYGVQFHPEMSLENMHERMEMYNRDHSTTFTFPKEMFDSIKSTEHAEKVVSNFANIMLEFEHKQH